MSSTTHQDLVTRIVKKSHLRDPYHKCINTHFEMFASRHVLKDPSLSLKQLEPEEIKEGNVGGTLDNGIDGLYLFVNSNYVSENNLEHFVELSGKVKVDLFFIQAKNSASTPIGLINLWMSTARDLLNPHNDLSTLAGEYEPKILKGINCFRVILGELQDTSSAINLHFYYVTKGSQRPSNIDRRVDQLRSSIRELVPTYNFQFKFFRASDLLEAIRQQPWDVRTLQLSPKTISMDGDKSFVALIDLRKYHEFTLDEHGALKATLFEANVRAWQGNNSVNENIYSSLMSNPVKQFWWLNNGVTILARKIRNHSGFLQLENPVIVNGLQTTYAIHNYFVEAGSDAQSDQTILVRIIEVEDDDESDNREHIIQATNSQTEVTEEQLRGLDEVHYDIQEYFSTLDQPLYYERRDKQYRNSGISRHQVVNIRRLTQAVLATALLKPDDARGRPRDYLRSSTDEKYRSVFNERIKLRVYEFCIRFYEKVDYLLRSDLAFPDTDRSLRRRLRYFIMTHVILRHLNIPRPLHHPHPLFKLLQKQFAGDISDDLMLDGANRVIKLHTQIMSSNDRFTWRRFEKVFFEELDCLLPSNQDAASS